MFFILTSLYIATMMLMPVSFSATRFHSEKLEREVELRLENLLNEYVSERGVDYVGLQGKQDALTQYLDVTANVSSSDFHKWPNADQLAFLINVYNMATLKLVLEHYPVKSIRDIGGFFSSPWKKKIVKLWDKTWTLDELEHQIIRPRYQEPRIHFALVCAARGCPPLRQELYRGKTLGSQLEDQTRLFISQSEKNYWNAQKSVLYLSPIFKWYRADFEMKNHSLLSFVGAYFPEPIAQLILEKKPTVQFTEYDWSLNDKD